MTEYTVNVSESIEDFTFTATRDANDVFKISSSSNYWAYVYYNDVTHTDMLRDNGSITQSVRVNFGTSATSSATGAQVAIGVYSPTYDRVTVYHIYITRV